MKNFIKIFPHIIIWAIILIVPVYLISREGTIDYKPYLNYVLQIGVFVILFYANYLYLIDKFFFNKKFLLYILINIGLIVVSVIIRYYISESMRPIPMDMPGMDIRIDDMNMEGRPPKFEGHRRPVGPPFFMRMIFDYVSIIFVIGLSVAIKTTARWYRDSINLEQAKTVQLEADLRNLKSQLNPHFLFNTLNNIYSLIAVNQDRAQEAIHRLSNLLRYVMYDNNEKFVPMDKELEFTRNYIDLMKLRLSPEVKLNVTIDGNGSRDLIASLMFMTLIENAFKHGINSGKDSFINISILVDSGKGVLCTVENSTFEKEKNMESRTGIGLTNLSKRLELLYPDKYEFVTEKRIDSFFALLRIDFGKQKELS
ncbi:hypothetical protein GGR21_001126 [Dysgonomonas hofstadii]|uniref:Signal transduction histidine kinase internal region domain-containing protein n=1 Tax=Dysgonomonas hofstadii TaxID=637886 RepID=A0A840CGX2_9BACT|nr:histidine kinase [Dysgonomonas hofstadii]MBB4035237.1 hypothetical protein [Dysgonomonas hofstadii]